MLRLVSFILVFNFFQDGRSQLGGNYGFKFNTGFNWNTNNFGYYNKFNNIINVNTLPIYSSNLPCINDLVVGYSKGEKIPYDFVTKTVTGELKEFDPDVHTSLILHSTNLEDEYPYIEDFITAMDKYYNKRRNRLGENLFFFNYSALVSKDNYKDSLKNLPYIAKCIAEIVNAVLPWGFWAFGNEIGASVMTHLADHINTTRFIRAAALSPTCNVYGEPDIDLAMARNIAHYKDSYHCCGLEYGLKCGDTDFYVNLKEEGIQPGCPTDDATKGKECSLFRCWEIMTESAQRDDVFFGFKCNYINPNFDYDCPDENANFQGGQDYFTFFAGYQYALNTSYKSPYALGQYDTLEDLREKNKDVLFLD